jgi:Oxidoreductase family, NAD-binding Rossmann fold
MRVAVIGLGRMGRFYAQTIAALGPATQLSAVADPDPVARVAVKTELGGPHVFAEAAAIFDRPAIDAVVIATPTSTHAELVVAAAQAGKAIFCEKPLALSLQQTEASLAAVQQADVLLQVGFMRRFDPGYVQAQALIQSGRIGRPLTFKAVGRDPSCPPLEYADPAHSGGLVLDVMTPPSKASGCSEESFLLQQQLLRQPLRLGSRHLSRLASEGSIRALKRGTPCSLERLTARYVLRTPRFRACNPPNISCCESAADSGAASTRAAKHSI